MSNISWFLGVISLFILFFIGGPSYYSSPVFKELWNTGHILFFTLTTYKLISLIKHKSTSVILASSLIYCFTLGALIELVQSKIGRCLDLHDIYRNALGAFLALSIYIYQKKRFDKGVFLASSYFIIAGLLIWWAPGLAPIPSLGLYLSIPLMVLAIAGLLLWKKDFHRGLILIPETELRVAPTESANPLSTLSNGTWVEVLETHDPYHYIRTPDKQEGWVKDVTIGKVWPND